MNSGESKFVSATAKTKYCSCFDYFYVTASKSQPPLVLEVHIKEIKRITIHITDHEIYGFDINIRSFIDFYVASLHPPVGMLRMH